LPRHQRRDDDDFDPPARIAQRGLYGRPRRRVAGRNPRVPDRVHGANVGNVAQEDLALQDAALVAARLFQQALDVAQDLARLRGHVGIRRLVGNLARQVHRVVEDGRFGKPGAHMQALQGRISHGRIFASGMMSGTEA
jgi:hypothetical protein